MKILLLVVFLPGCALFTVPHIKDPATGVEYKGKSAVQVYAHLKQQEQLAQRWDWLKAEAARPTTGAVDAATRNMLMQAIALEGIEGSGGGEYFRMLAAQSEARWKTWQTALAVGLPLVAQAILYDDLSSGGDISETINVGGDVNMSNSGSIPTTIAAAPAVGTPPTTVAPPPSFTHPRSMSFGGIGNLVSSPEGVSAFYRSVALQNRASGTLQHDNNKPMAFKDNSSNTAPLVSDDDDVRHDLF